MERLLRAEIRSADIISCSTGIQILLLPSVQMTIEKPVQAVTCIVRGLAVVFQPVIEHRPAGLAVPVVESMMRARIDDSSIDGPSLLQLATLSEQLPPASNSRVPQ
jgi:hypothetical protein